MNADIILDGEQLLLSGHVIQKNATSEIHVSGPVSGYAFSDRNDDASRYVLYSVEGRVSLYKDGVGDILSISHSLLQTMLQVDSVKAKSINTGLAEAEHLIVSKDVSITGAVTINYQEQDPRPAVLTAHGLDNTPRMISKQMDVVKTIQDLQHQINDLKSHFNGIKVAPADPNSQPHTGPITIKR